DEPHEPSAGCGDPGVARPHRRLPARVAGRKHLHSRLGRDCTARDELARRDRGLGDRGGAGGFACSLMNAEIWAAVGTTIAMLVLFIVPGLVYTWYALESMIGDRESYASVIAQTDDVPVRN